MLNKICYGWYMNHWPNSLPWVVTFKTWWMQIDAPKMFLPNRMSCFDIHYLISFVRIAFNNVVANIVEYCWIRYYGCNILLHSCTISTVVMFMKTNFLVFPKVPLKDRFHHRTQCNEKIESNVVGRIWCSGLKRVKFI